LPTFLLFGQIYFGGVPAYPYVTEYKQPDGSTLNIIMKGDEMVNWAVTEDGYSLIKNPINQGWEYAVVNSKNDMISSGMLAHNPTERNQSELLFLPSIQKGYQYSKKQIRTLRQQFPLTRVTKI